MPTGRKAAPRAKRGKRPRREHWIYDVERALGLDHSDIARLLTPGHLSTAAVRDICNSLSNTPALHGLEFPVGAAAVSKIIAGESQQAAIAAEFTLWLRVGVRWNEYSATGEILGFDRTPFGKDSLKRYLADREQAQQTGVVARRFSLNRFPPRFSDSRDE